MHIRLIAVGDRQPAWVDDAFDEYARRLPGQWRFRLDTVAAAVRGPGGRRDGDSRKAVEDEGTRLLRKLKSAERVVVLDEAGAQHGSAELAQRLSDWQAGGSDLAFVIGGADGLSEASFERANERWSLSKLTLPHGLVRVIVAEQLYRAWTLLQGHPYHRG